jgi:threonine/homoserine/homoserine lactone efflux protein
MRWDVWTAFVITETALCLSIEFCVLLGYGALAGRMTRFAARPRFAKLTNRVAGSMLIIAGVGMASLKRA